MGILDSVPSHVTDEEIQKRIRELEATTEEDNPRNVWDSVEALEEELRERHGQRHPYESGFFDGPYDTLEEWLGA
jgi:hypothetical protein